MSNNTEQNRALRLLALQQRIRACRLCEEQGYIAKAQPLTHGTTKQRIMLIGQAPGHLSVAQGLPFTGPGGRLLQKWLEEAGFPAGYLHEHIYLTSLTHCDPGKSPKGHGDRKPSPAELNLCRPYLEEEIELVQPEIILLVGGMAIERFFGKVRLEDVIGTYKQEDGKFLLPLPHPSGVSRWLNDPDHQQLLHIALELLADWRINVLHEEDLAG